MLEEWFKLREHKTTAGTEVVAGLTTFMVMAYIIFVNPTILSFAGVRELGGQGPPLAPPARAPPSSPPRSSHLRGSESWRDRPRPSPRRSRPPASWPAS